jgi:hypothetical protein
MPCVRAENVAERQSADVPFREDATQGTKSAHKGLEEERVIGLSQGEDLPLSY